jgi:hypothetical protein
MELEQEALMFIDPKSCLDFYLKKSSELNFEILKKIEKMTLSGEFQNLVTICINNKNSIIYLDGGLIDTMISILRSFLVYRNIDLEIINIVMTIIENSIRESSYEEIPGEIPSNKMIISRASMIRLWCIGGIDTLEQVYKL